MRHTNKEAALRDAERFDTAAERREAQAHSLRSEADRIRKEWGEVVPARE